jgi:hypothetical protein
MSNPKDSEQEITGYFIKGRTKSRWEQQNLKLSLCLKLI